MTEAKRRCQWCGEDPLYVAYHDLEWGVPVRDDEKLFECLTLEGAQAGLSWLTILRKREGYRRAFRGFVPKVVVKFTERDVQRLLEDEGIVRHERKIRSVINNAKRIREVQNEFRSFATYVWSWVDDRPIVNRWASETKVPASTDLSERFAKDLRKRGFQFVGPTTVYAFMQATGLVNDHVIDCFRHKELAGS